MKPVVVLDAGPVGLLCNPNPHPKPVAIRKWVDDLLVAGRRVVLPEVTDYEVRREFNLSGLANSLDMLNDLTGKVEYLPVFTAAWRLAAELWADARRGGYRPPRTRPSTAM